MRQTAHRAIVAALTVFLTASTATNVGIAGLYARAVTRLKAGTPIGGRDIRIFARPMRIAVGQRLSRAILEEHLQQIGYYAIAAHEPGCYVVEGDSLTLSSRYPEFPDVTLQWNGDEISRITTSTGEPLDEALVEPEPILSRADDPGGSPARTSSDPIPYAALVGTPLLDAIIASEDRLFPVHHGVDFGRLVSVPFTGGGASTITMQVARLDVLRDRRRTLGRKLNEIGLAIAIERLYSKQQIITAYVNAAYLGISRGRAVLGFGAAAREFFGVRDVRQLTGDRAATLVALLNQPSRYLDDLRRWDDRRLRRQRNRVLRLMQRNFPGRYSESWARELEQLPIALSPSIEPDEVLHKISRHYLDYALADLPRRPQEHIYLTLDANLQRLAADVVDRGVAALERGRPRVAGWPLQAALVATNPQTGEVLAMVGGRSYDDSQFNRATSAERQVGSILKPFDYLAAFERAAADGNLAVSPTTLVVDEPMVFNFPGLRPWKPANYENNYAGAVTWRRALAESRNVAAVKVAAWAGIGRVARLWEMASDRRLQHVFPSIALGAIEATPVDVARSYAMFATDGMVRPLRAIVDVVANGRKLDRPEPAARRVAAADTTAIVRDMMRAVVDEGTARSVRAAGFTLDAAGKTGTTDDLRDAWFAGFAGDLLAVVWVGRDDAKPLGLTGAQAALPIWTEFMKRALQPGPDDPHL